MAEVVPETELVSDTKLPAEVPETCVPVEIKRPKETPIAPSPVFANKVFPLSGLYTVPIVILLCVGLTHE